MNPASLLGAANTVLSRHNLPELSACQWQITTVLCDDYAALLHTLRDFAPDEGWLGCQSHNILCQAGELTLPPASRIIDGELYARARDESLHLRHDGQGGWLLTRYTVGGGKSGLSDTVTLLGANREVGTLTYQRLWCHDPRHGLHQFAARFTGFGGKD